MEFEIEVEIETEDITEHDDKTRPYLCTVCDKRFIRKHHLKVHRQIHTGVNKYSCSECEKSFSSQSGLSNHKNIPVSYTHLTLPTKRIV